MTKGKIAEQGNERWTVTIDNHVFKMHANSMYSVNIERFYGKQEPITIRDYNDIDKVYGIDYTIEDAKANVKIRLGQSGFRKAVLENFQNECCISGISEQTMLVASHIVPWSANKNYRSDPGNGLCLFIEYDAYFDKGYITIDKNLNIIVT
jgi:putative restriction endonuclease